MYFCFIACVFLFTDDAVAIDNANVFILGYYIVRATFYVPYTLHNKNHLIQWQTTTRTCCCRRFFVVVSLFKLTLVKIALKLRRQR